MASGGHARSGPKPDPNALRRNRAGDEEWTTLPLEGFKGTVPEFPLDGAFKSELALWSRLWKKPQAIMWDKLGMELDVAAYVRAFLESVEPEASAGLKTAVLRMSAEIGLSLPGMHSFRWRFAEDELAKKRDAPVKVSGKSARDRLASGS